MFDSYDQLLTSKLTTHIRLNPDYKIIVPYIIKSDAQLNITHFHSLKPVVNLFCRETLHYTQLLDPLYLK